tara:strand:- start:594 stop:842 length:249 start_codon:yes stop_codon:yes gene_type:complete
MRCCGACRSLIILYFETYNSGFCDPDFCSDFLTTGESINSLTLKDKGTIILDDYLPEIAEISCPDYCLDNVQRAFTEAEKAL